MPQLIRTPEDIFRAEKRDIYALHWLANSDDVEWISWSVFQDIWAEMVQWFAQHMPDSPTEFMACSEHSGIIVGGPISLRIALTDSDLQRFCQIWETPDGKSIDPRFQCYQHAYQQWWEERGHFAPTQEQPLEPGVAVWIDSPIGILSHVLTDDSADMHPGNERNLWANACAKWPQLQGIDLDDLCHGQVMRGQRDHGWMMLWDAPFDLLCKEDPAQLDQRWHHIADWLGLASDTVFASKY